MYTKLEMPSNVKASNLAAQLEGHKYKTEERLAMGLSCWSNLKHQTEITCHLVEKLHDGKDLVGEMLSQVQLL